MTRARLADLLGVLVAVSSVLLLLAGSDLPPPLGFAWVIAVALVAGFLVRSAVPRMLVLRDRAGIARALGYTFASGLAAGSLVGLFFVARGSGEPSTPPPGLPEIALFLVIVGAVGGCAAASLGAVAVLSDRAPTRAGAVMTVAVPGVLILLFPLIVIGGRLQQ